MRLHNGLACAVILLLGRARLDGSGTARDAAAALAVILLCSAAHLVNDLLDVAADRRNRPDRALPAATLKPAVVRRAAAATWAGGLLVGLVSVPQWAGWWLFWGLAGPGYTLFAKGRGWLAPSWTAVVIASCWLAGVSSAGLHPADLVALGLLMTYLLFRELVKAAADRRGDLLAGYRSPGRPGRGLQAEVIALAAVLLPAVGGLILLRPRAAILVSGLAFVLCTGAAAWLAWRPRTGSPHLAGTILKLGAFAGAPLLWYL